MRLDRNPITSPILGSPNNGVATNGSIKLESSEIYGNGVSAARNGTAVKLEGGTGGAAAGKAFRGEYFGHDRAEVTRILIQGLLDLGYNQAAATLETESEYTLENSYVSSFRQAVLEGQWRQAEILLCSMEINQDVDCNEMLFHLRQQKFLELLESRDVSRALRVLRMELTPLNYSVDTLHFLSSLMMCLSAEDLQNKAGWDGAMGQSRQQLLLKLSKYISPSIMLPEHRLASLLQQVKDNQVKKCVWHNGLNAPNLYTDHHCDRNQFPHYNARVLTDHSDEVLSVQFSNDGRRLASASRDKTIIVWDVDTWEPIHILGEHNGAVTNLNWSPDGTRLVSVSLDKTAKVWDTASGRCLKTLTGFSEPVSSVAWMPDGRSFVTGILEEYLIQWSVHGEQLEKTPSARTYDLKISPNGETLIAASLDKLHIYDLHTWEIIRELDLAAHRSEKVHLTGLQITKDWRFALVNTGKTENQMLILVDLESGEIVKRYKGPKQEEWIIKGCLGGQDERFVVSGSEDTDIYIWNRATGEVVDTFSGHTASINCAAWNPVTQPMFASASDDATIRIWSQPPKQSRNKGKMPGTLTNGFYPR